jgi:uncharacterized protein YdeI (YjbR/CyaY-like superfamily)
MIANIDWYFDPKKPWYEEKLALRKIALRTGLDEGLTYGKPTYYVGDKKIFLIHTFKDYAALLFFKGVLMDDPQKILIQQTANVQAGRQLRFTSLDQIKKMEKTIKDYIQEAIKVEKSGREVVLKKTSEYAVPVEFESALADSPELADAFYALTPGRQRGYLLYFGSAKQAKTREDRITKSIPYILRGKGLMMGNRFEE